MLSPNERSLDTPPSAPSSGRSAMSTVATASPAESSPRGGGSSCAPAATAQGAATPIEIEVDLGDGAGVTRLGGAAPAHHHDHDSAALLSGSWRQDISSFQFSDIFAKSATRSDRVKSYYEKQQDVIKRYLELDALQHPGSPAGGVAAAASAGAKAGAASDHPLGAENGETASRGSAGGAGASGAGATAVTGSAAEQRAVMVTEWATRLSLVLNVILLGIKAYAAIQSGSLTVAASLVDSALDLFSGAVLVVVGYLQTSLSSDDFPMGKKKFEPLGTLVFSCAMCIASAKLIEESVKTFAENPPPPISIDIVTFVVVGLVIVFKFIAFLICRKFADLSDSVDALAMDHRNDVVSNLVGLVGIIMAKFLWRYIDPIVALVTTLIIMFIWGRSAYLQVLALSGRTAPPEVLNALTLLARNHDARVVAVDTVRCVTAGDGFIVEIDLVLPGDMPLREAHDIGESFQLFLERLEGLDVARAYVHLDYETTHNPREHQ